MNKSEISKEIISKLKIEIEDTLFYMPGETVKGTIKLFPGVKYNISDNLLHFELKLIQYEFWEYSNIKKIELNNIHKTEVKEKVIEYKLKDEENLKKEEHVNFGDFSMILIEKEEENKFISIPFEFTIDDNNEKLLPTFQYETDTYFLGIRHLLVIKNIDYCSKNYIGLFIGKSMNSKFKKEKKIFNNYYAGLGTLDVNLTIPKQNFYFGESIPFKLESTTNLLFKKITEFKGNLYRNIEWVGFFKNTLLDEKNLSSENLTYNHDKYSMEAKLNLPLEIFNNFRFCKSLLFNGFLGFFGISYFIIELCSKYRILQEILRLDAEKIDFNEKEKINTKFNDSLNLNYNEKELKEATEEIKKFVYFKDKKIIGFVKFVRDITPPLNGYYFNCNYNFIINIHIAGMVFDQDKTINSNIEFYDGEEYIQKMKDLLKV